MPQPQLILRPFIYGLLTCMIALLIREAFLTPEMRYTSNWTAFLVLFILCLGAFAYFKQNKASLISTVQIFSGSLIFGLGTGIAIALSCYLTMTLLEPDYLQRAVNASHTSWAARGYSKVAIAAQWEITDAFQNPLKHSLTVALFYFLLTAGLSSIIGFLTGRVIRSAVAADDLRHA